MSYKRSSKLTFFLTSSVLIAVLVMVQRVNSKTMRAELPNDMPQGAKFIATGMNAATHDRTGEWVACHEDHDQGTDRCRVTDQSGVVLYDGDFLPAGRRARAIPDDQLQIGAFRPSKSWIASAEDHSPAPTIPLQNGALLVPAGQSNLPLSHWTEESGDAPPSPVLR